MPFMLFGALLSGVGVAAFHPEGFAVLLRRRSESPASGMVKIVYDRQAALLADFRARTDPRPPLIVEFGLHDIAWLLLPATVVAILVCGATCRAATSARAHPQRASLARGPRLVARIPDAGRRRRDTLDHLCTFFAAVTFLPFFAITVTHVTKVDSSSGTGGHARCRRFRYDVGGTSCRSLRPAIRHLDLALWFDVLRACDRRTRILRADLRSARSGRRAPRLPRARSSPACWSSPGSGMSA